MTAGAPAFPNIRALQKALQFAVFLEHFTIPPYLCALYSIQPGSNVEAIRIIQSVVVEEMLHMVMAANILNAIGGKPKIGTKKELPVYPHEMPHSEIRFEVNLLRFSKEAVNTFLRIERPATPTTPPRPGKIRSIGEFYDAVRQSMRWLDREARKSGSKKGIFTGNRPQVTHEYYGGGGHLPDSGICSLEDAEKALDEIVGQGEGIDGSIEDGDGASFGPDVQYAHYFRFNEIFHERRYQPQDKPNAKPSGANLDVDWNAVFNMIPNPTMSRFRGNLRVLRKMRDFNWLYTELLRNLNQACNGKPEVLEQGIPMMHLMSPAAVDLMRESSGIGDYTAGPSFEEWTKH